MSRRSTVFEPMVPLISLAVAAEQGRCCWHSTIDRHPLGKCDMPVVEIWNQKPGAISRIERVMYCADHALEGVGRISSGRGYINHDRHRQFVLAEWDVVQVSPVVSEKEFKVIP